MSFEIAKTAHKHGKIMFCLVTLGIVNYIKFGKKYMTEINTTSVR